MPNPTKLKQIFLKKWLAGLQSISSSNTNMDFLERKNAIKTTADKAMAATRNGATLWSRAIIAKSIKGHAGRALPEAITNRMKKTRMLQETGRRVGRKVTRSNLLRSRSFARSVAKRLVQKKTKVLMSLVPGGKFIEDEVLLIEEALDYITFLRAQVDGMRLIANCK